MTRSAPFLLVSWLSVVVCAQQAAPVQWFPADRVAQQVRAAPSPWQQLLDVPTLRVGRYRLAEGATDGQRPHPYDEVYFVVAGMAKLQAGKETRPVAAGDCVFVAARVPHRFVDVETDLDVLVFFSLARPATGGMATGPTPTEQTPYAETSARGNTRIFYWFGPDSAGQVAIDFGRPKWQPAFDRFMRQPKGQRWRFGENFWTVIDTNMPLTLGGIDVPVGQYYAVLQHRGDAGIEMVLLDPQEIRRRRLDAHEASKTTGGLVVPLEAGEATVTADRLDVELTVDRAQRDRGALTVRFGPHELRAPLQMQPHR
jgi:mannose-6-phosphate isomerase-like protein (cupin superfamily)